MLRVSSQVSIKSRGNDNLLRHKDRNLRAKVRSLLPAEVCSKDLKRNKRVSHIANSRQFIRKTMSTNLNWKNSLEKDQQFFYQKKSSQLDKINNCKRQQISQRKQVHLFERLTKDEIQHVQQNKHYFLGDQGHIRAFDSFLKKLRSYQYSPKGTKIKSPRISIFNLRNTIDQASLNKSNNLKVKATPSTNGRSTSINFGAQSLVKSRVEIQPFLQISYQQKVRKQRQRIEQLKNERLLQEKIRLKQKQQRVIENWTTFRQNNYATLRQKARKDDSKQLIAKIKRMKRQNYGEVVELNQKMRKMFIQNKT